VAIILDQNSCVPKTVLRTRHTIYPISRKMPSKRCFQTQVARRWLTLSQTLFPIGDFLKSEVRGLALEYKLPTAGRAESMGICFVGKRKHFSGFIGERAASGSRDRLSYDFVQDNIYLHGQVTLWTWTAKSSLDITACGHIQSVKMHASRVCARRCSL